MLHKSLNLYLFCFDFLQGDEVDARWLEEKIEMSFAEADKIQPCLLQG